MNRQPLRAPFGQLGNGYEFAADTGAAPTRRLHAPRGDKFSFISRVVCEKPLYEGAFRACAHHLGLGAAPDKQAQRVDQDRLARAGLAGQDVEAGGEVHAQGVDNSEILQLERTQHGDSLTRSVP